MNRRPKSPRSEDATEKIEDAVDDTRRFIDKAIGEIGEKAALQQLLLGSITGWLTGFVAMRMGTASGIVAGGSSVLVHYAQQKGYISLDWDKINKKLDKISDKIEKEATGSTPAWTEKLERFVDRKMDKAEDLLKKKQLKAKKWYHSVAGDEHYRATETHIFIISFVAGLTIGLFCGR